MTADPIRPPQGAGHALRRDQETGSAPCSPDEAHASRRAAGHALSCSRGKHRIDALLAIARLAGVVTWVPLSVGFEALLLPVPGVSKIRWTRWVWRGLCTVISLDVEMIGTPAGTVGGKRARARGERPVIYVSNHSSWLDIPVLGAKLYSVFVAKGISKNGRSWAWYRKSGGRSL